VAGGEAGATENSIGVIMDACGMDVEAKVIGAARGIGVAVRLPEGAVGPSVSATQAIGPPISATQIVRLPGGTV
jgi:hypothetical protein